MRRKKYATYAEIRRDLKRGVVIYWGNTSYQVTLEEIYGADTDTGKAQRKMPGVRNGTMPVARCISNGFGGYLHESELSQCFSIKGAVS